MAHQTVQHPLLARQTLGLQSVDAVSIHIGKLSTQKGKAFLNNAVRSSGNFRFQEEVLRFHQVHNKDMKKPPRKPPKVVKGQFLNQELDKDELEKVKRMARRIVKRNKRLGDLLGQ